MEKNKHCITTLQAPEYPFVMGILNITTDSFSGDGATDKNVVEDRVIGILRAGVTCIDVGAESTRPGAVRVEEMDEKERVVDAIKIIRSVSKDVCISIDTTRASIAQAAITEGVDIVNDISGGTFDPEMFNVIATNKNILYVVGHVIGNFETMHKGYEGKDIVEDVLYFWKQRIDDLNKRGVTRDRIICDPGIGFSKRLDENCELIKRASHLVKGAGVPVLFGVSRKRFIKTISESDNNDTLDRCSLFLHSALLKDGVSIIRTHEVLHTMKALNIYKTIYA